MLKNSALRTRHSPLCRQGHAAAEELRRTENSRTERGVTDFASELQRQVARVERGLDRHVPSAATPPARLHTAMRYSLEAGGKRLRPVLVLAAAELFGARDDAAVPAAVAVECIHTYSLIHDDLPCMDNDDLRRGRATAHRQFDEATALLAGDALLTHAFALLSDAYAANAQLAMGLVRELADAAGSRRLIGGQMADLLAEKKSTATAEELEFIHRNKTGAMIEAALVMGGLVGGASAAEISALRTAGRHLGLAFQIVDDVLDATADAKTLGKTPGKDAKSGKTTYVKLHGIDQSRRLVAAETAHARQALDALGRGGVFLQSLAEQMAQRVH
jgi:geranylgeranyl diphosphate synthase type II